jgi:hypothetical protein
MFVVCTKFVSEDDLKLFNVSPQYDKSYECTESTYNALCAAYNAIRVVDVHLLQCIRKKLMLHYLLLISTFIITPDQSQIVLLPDGRLKPYVFDPNVGL